MQTKSDLIDHVAAETGLDREAASKAADATLAFVRSAALQGGFAHPELGRLRAVKRQTEAGETRTIYRYQPNPKKGGGKGAGKRKAKA